MVEIKSNGGLVEECQREFKTSDLYAVLNLEKNKATPADIKKAYYKFSLKYHPDKSSKENEEENKVKFQILGKIYSILSDEESKKLYDDCGVIEGEDGLFSDIQDWTKYWRQMFKKITKNDIVDFYKKYRNSDEERDDLFKLYVKFEGNFEHILQNMFSEDLLEDESRFREMLMKGIDEKKLEKFDAFVNESGKKANKRKAKLEKEAVEAAIMRKDLGIDESQESLRNAILNKKKASASDDFLDQLASKYGGGKKSKPAPKAKASNTKKSKKAAVEEEDEEEEEEDFDEDEMAEEEEEDEESESEEEEEEEEKPSRSRKSRVKPAPKAAPKKGRAATARTSIGKAKKVKRL